MDYQTIIFEKEAEIAILRFNRPKALNAITPDVLSEVGDALDQVALDETVKVLVLTGEGDRAFVAGADISHMSRLSPLEMRHFSRVGQELMFKLENLSIPVMASVNGFALGGGLEICMACDFVYASEKAKFGQPEINLGLIPGFGGTQRLPRLIGKARAKELCMTGNMVSAREAREMGLINKVFAREQLWDETMNTARLIADKGRVSLKAVKDCVGRGLDVDLRDGCYMESDAFGLCIVSPDAKEGMKAFLEKRKAEFKGGLK